MKLEAEAFYVCTNKINSRKREKLAKKVKLKQEETGREEKGRRKAEKMRQLKRSANEREKKRIKLVKLNIYSLLVLACWLFSTSEASNSQNLSPSAQRQPDSDRISQLSANVDHLVAAGATSLQELEPARKQKSAGCLVDELAVAASSSSQEHSQPSGQQHKSQMAADSILLVKRNNRDFYRPSNVPANLLLASTADNQSKQHQQQVNATKDTTSAANLRLGLILATQAKQQQAQSNSPESERAQFVEVDKYKIVLDANSRQRLRDQLAQPSGGSPVISKVSNVVESDKTAAAASNNQFAYDKPLTQPPDWLNTNSTEPQQQQPKFSRPRLQYSSVQFAGLEDTPAPSMNSTLWSANSHQLNASSVGSTNPTHSANKEQLLSSSTSNAPLLKQRVLKFQPEDARDPEPGMRISGQPQRISITMSTSSSTSSRQITSGPAYETATNFGSDQRGAESGGAKQAKSLSAATAQLQLQQQQQSSGGCAFYDANCKRTSVGRLVHLPPTTNNKRGQHQNKSELISKEPTNAVNNTSIHNGGFPQIDQHLDSTFGETGATSGEQLLPQPPVAIGQQQQVTKSAQKGSAKQTAAAGFNRLNSPRVSLLNQPLPPWSEEEIQRANQHQQHNQQASLSGTWRAQDNDIARIAASGRLQQSGGGGSNQPQPAHGFTGGLSREQQKTANLSQQQQQMLFVPLKVLQNQSSANSIQAQVNNLTSLQFGNEQINHQAPAILMSSQTKHQPHTRPQSVFFNSNQQYHTPTPYSVSIQTTHMPNIFTNSGQTLSNLNHRLTNFTSFETLPADEISPTNFSPPTNINRATQKASQAEHSAVFGAHNVPKAPSAHRKQHLQQIQIDNNGSFGANFDLNPSNGEKQARKIVRLQAAPPSTRSQQEQQRQTSADYFNSPGDIIITSAKLTNSSPQRHPMSGSNNNASYQTPNGQLLFTSDGLATHASNQSPNVQSANVIRSVDQQLQQHDQATDFFQNRTIAEIMDDSGLRIDGQQVTFGRLKECLTEAELLSLITQTSNSLTIFMPTDSAFQRLVQQQALAHQRATSAASAGSRLSARLSSWTPELGRRFGLIPLVARMRPLAQATSSSQRLTNGPNDLGENNFPKLLDTTAGGSELDFSAINAGDKLTLDCSSNQVRQLLLDHLSAKLITPKQLQSDTTISALSGHQLLLSSVPSKKIVVVDGQPVIAATRAKNGMVYVVNKFLNLTQQMPNVIDLIGSQPNLSTFMSYLSFSSMSDRLKRETGPLTVLVPTNEAFSQLSSSARQLINSDPSALMDILRGHIVEGAQFGKLISMRNRLKTMNLDQNIEAKVVKPNVYLLDNQMTSMRLIGTTGNGVVNSIDRLIVPSWLKVSMGNKPSPITISTNNAISPSSNHLFSGEILDTSANSNNTSAHLPGISNQPLRFEQPVNRFGSSSIGNSFLLANSNTNSNKNNFDNGFDLSPRPINRDGIDSNTPTAPTTSTQQNSPFFRPTVNVITNTNNGENRLSNSDGDFLFGLSPKAANVTNNMKLIEKLANLMQAKKFIRYLLRSKVSESLKPDMNYVILVPTDQAIDKLPRQITDMLDRDMERLADLVNYHVLDTTFEYINTIPDGQTLNTLNEKDILFNWHRNNTILTASGAVVMGGIQEENIALLIVDRVLYPTPGDIMNIISKSPILSNFTSLVRNAGLEQQLSLAGPYTLFAPSDFAFNQLDKKDIELLQRDRDKARRFLLRHLSQPAIFTSSIALSNTTMVVSNSLGDDLTLRQRNDYFSVNEVNFSYADVAATNGVVHVIDGSL